jgi:hypothetical protein
MLIDWNVRQGVIPVIAWDSNTAKHACCLTTKTPKTVIVTGRKMKCNRCPQVERGTSQVSEFKARMKKF